jgi:hypothetical protein
MSGAAPILSVFSGQTCVGFVLTRGRAGFEAFDRDERTIGMFDSVRAAADAITRAVKT